MSTATPNASTSDNEDRSTNMIMANGLAAIMIGIVLALSVPDVRLPKAQIDCLTTADAVAHEARSRHGISLTCADETLARAAR